MAIGDWRLANGEPGTTNRQSPFAPPSTQSPDRPMTQLRSCQAMAQSLVTVGCLNCDTICAVCDRQMRRHVPRERPMMQESATAEGQTL